jgi:hypothetical protein
MKIISNSSYSVWVCQREYRQSWFRLISAAIVAEHQKEGERWRDVTSYSHGSLTHALRSEGGQATITEVSRHVWQHHEPDLRASGDLFFNWQYELRWAAGELRRAGRLKAADASPRGVWSLATPN